MMEPNDGDGARSQVTLTRQGDHWVVLGQIDVDSGDQFAEALHHACQMSPRGLVLDMSAVTHMDSTGLRELIAANNAGSRLTVRNATPALRRLFELTMADALIDVE